MSLTSFGEQILGLLPLTARRDILLLPKGTVAVHQGDALKHVFILTQGVIKLGYLTEDGRERIKSFLMDEGVWGPRPAAPDNTAPFTATCLSECRLVRIACAAVEDVLARSPEFNNQMMRFFDLIAQKKEARERDLLCLSATERYQRLLENCPALCMRLSQSDIANYLGITPVALSRIRSRLRTA